MKKIIIVSVFSIGIKKELMWKKEFKVVKDARYYIKENLEEDRRKKYSSIIYQKGKINVKKRNK